jgi:hypothetical protein
MTGNFSAISFFPQIHLGGLHPAIDKCTPAGVAKQGEKRQKEGHPKAPAPRPRPKTRRILRPQERIAISDLRFAIAD